MELQSDVPETWDFATFVEGQNLGSMTLCIDKARLRLWSEIFEQPCNSGPLSGSLLVSAMMEAYLRVAQPRPPGNIHAGQKLHLSGQRPKVGDSLEITTRVVRKKESKGRKWLTFESQIVLGDDTLLTGEILTIWAA